MQHFIKQLEEMKRRFNFEIDAFICSIKDLPEQTEKNSLKLGECNKTPTDKFATVKRLSEIHPSFTQHAIRAMIFSDHWNFSECLVKTRGRRIMIDVEKFENWIKKPKIKGQEYAHKGR